MSKRPAEEQIIKEQAPKIPHVENPVKRRIGITSLKVKDQEETKSFFVDKLGWKIHTDSKFPVSGGGEARWLTIMPSSGNVELTIESMGAPELVGKQAGDAVLFVYETPDIHGDFKLLKEKGVNFLGEIKKEPWGETVQFNDCCGNKWDLHQSEDPTLQHRVSYLTWIVSDVDKSKAWFMEKLGFVVTADKAMTEGHRWLTLKPSQTDSLQIVLRPATSEAMRAVIGKQSFVITTEDSRSDFESWKQRGVAFESDTVKLEAWGYWISFKDLDGNFIGLSSPPPANAPMTTPATAQGVAATPKPAEQLATGTAKPLPAMADAGQKDETTPNDPMNVATKAQ
jgi:catechol 2,3-dioxygenase-like lactoylglutathione lyase family enzyme